ncbi:Uncharacterized conserved protein, DUF433 family [Geodermatophilus africanus]|uniref:Uncharacterized conserved protein, DUF433 family n=1 Tax=Geodermatophilus africanus TaxID=1137993 RepID=A0A1H3QL57_9ACTN|nr:Uncharacterized conserved protein, DUF433 family [Geodermatophilus africanus]
MRAQVIGRSPVAAQAWRVRLDEVRTVEDSACWAGVGEHGHSRRVSSDRLGLIATDPAVLSGQAVIAGTRVPVSVVLDCLAAGMSTEQIVEECPTLTSEGVQAAAAYGALLAREELVPLGPE